jgi:hypothetical protein
VVLSDAYLDSAQTATVLRLKPARSQTNASEASKRSSPRLVTIAVIPSVLIAQYRQGALENL